MVLPIKMTNFSPDGQPTESQVIGDQRILMKPQYVHKQQKVKHATCRQTSCCGIMHV